MDDDIERLVYASIGPLAALLLGVGLMPFREFTSASNFTFLFLVITIVVAEFGGLWAALATALVSALSLDFFLTQPYMRLEISDKHDIIAFVGLAGCGLVAAALGARQGTRGSDLRAARDEHDLLHAALRELEGGAPIDVSAEKLLDACRTALPLAAIVLRDSQDSVVAANPTAKPRPGQILQRETLLPLGATTRGLRQRAVPLPAEGGRLALVVDGQQVGWLDVWGTKAAASEASRRTLSDVGTVAAALLARRKNKSMMA